MMMMGIHFMGEVPFKTVLIHNRVLDEQGAKMSKTKGNVVDPLTLIDEFGADALRFTLALAAGQSRDMRIGPTRVETGRNFATKLWNTSRFCEMNGCVTVPGFDPAARDARPSTNGSSTETANAVGEVTALLEALRFNDAAGAAYHFVYDVFCDWYVEITKPIFQAGSDDGEGRNPRHHRLGARPDPEAAASLHALHHRGIVGAHQRDAARHAADRGRLAGASPRLPAPMRRRAEMHWVIELIKGVRSVRAEMNVPAGAKIPLVLTGAERDRQGAAGAQQGCHPDPGAADQRPIPAAAIPKGSAQFVLEEAVWPCRWAM